MLTGVKIHAIGPRELGDRAEFQAKKNQRLEQLLARKVLSCSPMPTNGKLAIWIDKAKFNASKLFLLACGIATPVLKASLGIYFQKTQGGVEGKVTLPANAWVLLIFEESAQVAQGVLYWGKEAFLLKLGAKRQATQSQPAKATLTPSQPTKAKQQEKVKPDRVEKEEPKSPVDPIRQFRQFLNSFPGGYLWVMSWLRLMIQPINNQSQQNRVVGLIPENTFPPLLLSLAIEHKRSDRFLPAWWNGFLKQLLNVSEEQARKEWQRLASKPKKRDKISPSLIEELLADEAARLARIQEQEAAEEAEAQALEAAALRRAKKRPKKSDLDAISQQEQEAERKKGEKDRRKKRNVVVAGKEAGRSKPSRAAVWEDNAAPITKWYHSEPVAVSRGQVSDFCIAQVHCFGDERDFQQWLEQRFQPPVEKIRQSAVLSGITIGEDLLQLAVDLLKGAILWQVKQASNGNINYLNFTQACSLIRDKLPQCFTLQSRCYNGNSASVSQEIVRALSGSDKATELAEQLVAAHLSAKQLQKCLIYVSQLLSSGVR